MPIQCERSGWPTVVYRILGAVSDADMRQFIDELENDLDRSARDRQRHVAVIDTREMPLQDPRLRHYMREWLARRGETLPLLRAGLVYVIDRSTRGSQLEQVGQAMQRSTSYPLAVCDSLVDALMWAEQQIRAPQALARSS